MGLIKRAKSFVLTNFSACFSRIFCDTISLLVELYACPEFRNSGSLESFQNSDIFPIAVLKSDLFTHFVLSTTFGW